MFVKKAAGNILDFVTIGITMLAISIVVMAAFNSMGLMLRKLEVSQVARKYILVMETKGCLTNEDCSGLLAELSALGMSEIDISGTTRQPVHYGATILLSIRGKIAGQAAEENIWSEGFKTRDYYVEETRMSTAKN